MKPIVIQMELRYDSDHLIKIMESALSQFENELTEDEKIRLYTNLAFFYEEDGDRDKNVARLQKEFDDIEE